MLRCPAAAGERHLLTAAALSVATCPDKILSNHSIYEGGTLVASTNVTEQASCCALCHGLYHDECQGWEWINTSIVHEPAHHIHNCDIFAKVGRPMPGWPGRISGVGPNAPAPSPPLPPSGKIGPPCHSDGDCAASWGGSEWRCLEDPRAAKTGLNGCHMHATTVNTTCACQASGCGGGRAVVGGDHNDTYIAARPSSKKYLVIGDSISEGMQRDLSALMTPDGWLLSHNPGNGDNTNYGAHCVPQWVSSGVAGPTYDIISFQFGLHDIAHDEERLSVVQYRYLLRNITAYLVGIQRQQPKLKLLWVKTTPVPTVATYGRGCNGTATTCLNPARFDSDVVLYNEVADQVMAAANAQGAKIATADLYSFVVAKCGGQGYHSCSGFQLPMNVHYTPAGWKALAGEMRRVLLTL